MIIAASGDIHSPRFFEMFVKAVDSLNIGLTKPDIFLLIGDVINRGKVSEYRRVYNVLFGKVDCPIVACFGNDEFGEKEKNKIRKDNSEIIFLEDESVVLEIEGKKVGIVGTKGSLDRPTYWQSRNIPGIVEEYKERVSVVKGLLSELKSDLKILLMHYVPTYKLLEGENPWIFPELGSKEYERVIIEGRPDLVLAGHAHKGKKQVWVDSVPVFNVGILLNKKIVVIDTEKDLKAGLEKFF